MKTLDSHCEQLEQDGAIIVIHYGSSVTHPETANDIDLVAIYPKGTQRSNYQLADFDVTRLSEEDFEFYRKRLNPVNCVEPCLTGTQVIGDDTWLLNMRATLEETDPSWLAVRHNFRRSCETFEKSIDLFREGDATSAIQSLSFAVSYRLYASWYARERSPVPLTELQKKSNVSDFAADLFDTIKRFENEESNSETFLTALEEWERIVTTEPLF